MEVLQIVNILLETIGNVTLAEARTWLEVEENAKALKKEAQAQIVSEGE